MFITLYEVRNIIKEEITNNQRNRIIKLINNITNYAITYVNSIEAQQPDDKLGTIIKDNYDDIISIVPFISRKQDMILNHVINFVNVFKDFISLIGFWKRPFLIGKQNHVKKLKISLSQIMNIRKNLQKDLSRMKY